MVNVVQFIGALLLTYWLSRAIARVFVPGSSLGRLVVVHLASLVMLWVVLGVLRAHFTAFAYAEGVRFVAPQLSWFFYDLMLAKATSAARAQGSRR